MTVLYLSQSKLNYSVNAVYIKGLEENNSIVNCYQTSKGLKGFFEAVRHYINDRGKTDIVIIGYDSPVLVIFLRPFCGKKIIYNAILPVYERLIISRNLTRRWSLKGVYYWLIDFFAFHFSNLTMLETDHQIDFVSSFYFVSKDRFFRAWAGVNEGNFFYEPTVAKLPNFTVIFRGAFMPEAGVEYAVRAAKILEDENIKFVLIGGGILLEKIKELIDELRPANVELITDFLPYEKLREIMQKCHLSLGQLSNHGRLTRTIPHKAYESLAMKLPYLTASNSGVLELLTPDKTCLTCNPADAKSLAEKILWVKNNYLVAEKIAENGYGLYQNKLKTGILAKNLMDRI